MTWVLIWLVLVVAAATLFTVLGIRIFRQAKAVIREASAASERLAGISARLADRSDADWG